MRSPDPALSIVVAVRAGEPPVRARLQSFVDRLCVQSMQHGLELEVIVVDYSSATGRRLADELHRPEEDALFSLRVIDCSADTRPRGPRLSPWAWNAGIRRARGRFILATQLDVAISNELVAFIASGGPREGRLYRIDSRDVRCAVRLDACLDDQLAHCRLHGSVLHARDGNYWLTPDGRRLADVAGWGTLAVNDIATPATGLSFGRGWHAPESGFQTRYRWAQDGCVLFLMSGEATCVPLNLAIEPGPSQGFRPFRLEVRDTCGKPVGDLRVTGASLSCLRLPVLPNRLQAFTLHVDKVGKPAADGRQLDFRVFQPIRLGRALLPWHRRHLLRWLGRLIGRSSSEIAGPPTDSPVAAALVPQPPMPSKCVEDVALRDLHLNACDDFIFMARQHWHDLRGFPELEIGPRYLAEMLCLSARWQGIQQEILQEPIRLYCLNPPMVADLHESIASRASGTLGPGSNREQLLAFARLHSTQFAPVLLNSQDWGLARERLPERTLQQRQACEFAMA